MKRKKENQKALPTGWREVRLGEIYNIWAGGDFDAEKSSLTQAEKYPYPIYSNALTNKGLHGYSTYAKYDEDSITITARGDIGFANHRKTKFMAIGRLLVLKNKVPVLNEFVCEYINHCILFFKETTGVPQLTAPQASKYYITLPSLPEQKAIASLLEKWDTAIEKTEALIAAKEKRFKWLLKTLINDQQNNPGWQKVKLGEIANLYQPKTIPKKDMRRNGQYKVFGANGVIGYYHKYNHEEAEIAVVCRGATCGRVNMTEPKSWITGNAMVVKPDKGCVKKSYLYYFLSGASLTACISGAAQPQITRQDLFHFQTIISTNSEQKQIATTLETAEREIELQKRLTEQCRRQKHGLMQKLLTGEWRLIPSFPRKWK